MRNNTRKEKDCGLFFGDHRDEKRAQHHVAGEVRKDMTEYDIGV